MHRRYHLAAMLVAALSSAVSAQPNQAHGQQVALGGGSGGPSIACFSCHGLQGAGDGSAAFPRLAGQAAFYLYKQLKDFASGTRPNRIMTPIAKKLTDAERLDVAAFYAAAEAPFPPPPETTLALLAQGKGLAENGTDEIPACNSCHGPQGVGIAPGIPALAGQYPDYLGAQLRAWREGRRNNDPLNGMQWIARELSEAQIRAVSLYFASVQPLNRHGVPETTADDGH